MLNILLAVVATLFVAFLLGGIGFAMYLLKQKMGWHDHLVRGINAGIVLLEAHAKRQQLDTALNVESESKTEPLFPMK